jgi:hypothetical protein
MGDLEVIAARPRESGSEGNAAAREHLVREAEAAGLQATVGQMEGARNVVVDLPGSRSTGAILVTAHYDSAAGAPGAGDDGVGVVATLEAMRVLAGAPPLRNDVVFLFTDGEETGWTGARAFVASPMFDRVRMVIAMEGEPGNGPTTLQQTGRGDAAVIEGLARADPPVFASSSWNSPERADHDSDFDVFSAEGLPGLEFANPKDATRYHTVRDTIDAVDPSLVQSHGETVLALVRHFGDLELESIASSRDRVFVTLPLVGVVSSSTASARGAAVFGALIATAVVCRMIRSRRLSAREALGSVLLALIGLAVLSGVAAVLWDAIANRWAPADIVASFDDFDGSGVAMALVVLATVVIVLLLARRVVVKRGSAAVMMGALGVLIVAHAVFFLSQPLALPNTTWPLVASAGAVAASARLTGPGRLAALAAAATAPLLLLVPQLLLWVDSPSDGAAPPVAVTTLLLAALVAQLLEILGSTGRDLPRHQDANGERVAPPPALAASP